MIKSGIVRKYKGKGILHMSILEAVLLGIIQGITEFLEGLENLLECP